PSPAPLGDGPEDRPSAETTDLVGRPAPSDAAGPTEPPGGVAGTVKLPPESSPLSKDSGAGLPVVPGYEVLAELGRGGMGVVYKAQQISLNRPVALKMIRDSALASPEQLSRLRTEANAAARLQHPHIVQIYDLYQHNGLPFYAMEYVPGGTLAQILQ